MTLSAEEEQRINRYVDFGFFGSTEEVVARAMKLLDDEMEMDKVLALRERLESGVAEVGRGEFITSEQWEAEMDKRRKRRSAA